MLKQIFESLLPDNIKDIPLVKDAVDIFVKNLEENSDISIQIRNMFTSDNTIIKENLFKVYLNSLYTILTELQQNQPILQKLEDAGRTNALLRRDIKEILNEEYFVTSKTFKQNKGTRLGIEYAYNLTKKIEGDESAENLFRMVDIKPFHFRTEGSVMKEMYEAVVKPLAHPIGFTHTYRQVIKKSLQDLFGFRNLYTVHVLEVRNINGFIDVFTPAKDDEAIKQSFLTRINTITGQPYSEAEYYTYVNVYLNKTIKTFETTTEEIGTYVSILFDDDTFLEQYPSPLAVYYRNYVDEINDTGNYLKVYGEHSSLYVEYDQDFEFLYTDELNTGITVDVSHIDDTGEARKVSELFYGILGIDKCFKVGGNTYSYVQGIDETHPSHIFNDTSTASYITKLIGQLRVAGTYSHPDTLVNGLYTEGNIYNLTYNEIPFEETFINIGRVLVPTNSNEHIIMTNTGEVDEDFNIFQISNGGNYLVTEEYETLYSQPITVTDWDSLLTYPFGTYVKYLNKTYIAINRNDLDLNDNINKAPDLFSSTYDDYWLEYTPPAVLQGFYLYSLTDKVYFRVSPDV